MKTTTLIGRVLVVATFVAPVALFASACDLTVGPPPQDIGYEHNVRPAQPGYCAQVLRKGRSPKCSDHSSRVRSRPTARQANPTVLVLDSSQS